MSIGPDNLAGPTVDGAENSGNKHQFFAHLQADRGDDGDDAKDWTDGVQKSDMCRRAYSRQLNYG